MSFKGHTHADHSNSLGKKVIKKKTIGYSYVPPEPEYPTHSPKAVSCRKGTVLGTEEMRIIA